MNRNPIRKGIAEPFRKLSAILTAGLLVFGYVPKCTSKVYAISTVSLEISENGYVIVPGTGTEAGSTDDNYFVFDDANMAFVSCTENDAWVAAYHNADQVLELRNFTYEGDLCPFDLYAYSGALTIVLTGTNSITMTDADGLEIPGTLIWEGDGSLNLINQTGSHTDPTTGDEYVPTALMVGYEGEGNEFVNHCTGVIHCVSQNDEIDFNLDNIWVESVINAGNIKGRGVIGGIGVFEDLVPYTTTYTEPVRAGYTMKGKAYYYGDSEDYEGGALIPNNIAGTLPEGTARISGQYDEEGRPIPSTDFYQNYLVSPRGTWVTMDFEDTYMFLLYGTTAEVDALPTADDVVSVQDAEVAHTFNTDLYCAIAVEGSMTVNGNIIGELTLMENAVHTDYDDEKEAFSYLRDTDGNIVFMEDSSGAKAVINGDVGFVSLNKSYKGDASITGKIMGIYYADDIHVGDYDQPETWEYGAAAKTGQLVNKGSFISDAVTLLEGFEEVAVYDEEYCYVMTGRKLNNEEVVGTTAVVDDTALLVDISAKNLPEDTHPLVRELSDSEEKAVIAKLPETTKSMVMDIALISENIREVEPSGAVNLYLDGLEGFTHPVVYHVKDNGTVEKVYTQTGAFDGNLQVPVDSFSVYVIAEDVQETVTTATTEATTTAAATASTSDATTTADSDNNGKNVSPKTGDTAGPIGLLFGIMLISLVGAVRIIKIRQ